MIMHGGYNRGFGGIACVVSNNSSISNCYNIGEVYNSTHGNAGIVVSLENSTVENSYNAGALTNGYKLMGIVGSNKRNNKKFILFKYNSI